jgi:uncharacterized integral membrane protein
MKIFFLIGSVFFTVLILIIAFQNIQAVCSQVTIFFSPVNTSPTVLFFGVSLLGIFAGGFYFGFITSLMRGVDDEEEME